MIIKLLVDGGAMKINPGIAQKLGPLGMNIGKITSEINKSTAEFKGMKVPVTLEINTSTKEINVVVGTPPASELLKKEFSLQKGSGAPGETKVANAAIEHVIKVAKIKQEGMMVNSLKEAVKSILGSCVSLGFLVESKDPREIIEEVNAGKYDDVIEKGSEVPSPEKMQKLKKEFAKEQAEEAEKAAEVAKEAEEAEAAKVAKAAEGAEEGKAEGAEGAEAVKEGEAAPAEAAAGEEKKEEAKEEKK